MGKTKARLLAKWAEREAEYQRMLGLETSDDPPVEAVVTVAEAEVAEVVQAVVAEAAPPRPAKRRRERRPVPPQPTEVKPYQVACPRCAAQPGAPCHTGAGRPVRPHTDRLRQAARSAPASGPEPPDGEAGGRPDAMAHFFETARETPAAQPPGTGA